MWCRAVTGFVGITLPSYLARAAVPIHAGRLFQGLRRVGRALSFALPLLVGALACGENGPEREARANLTSILRDSVGAATDPKVAFIIEGNDQDKHLYMHFDTSAFPNMTDSAYGLRAREIAQLSMRHYEKINNLDSITVASRENLEPGVARIHHRRAFSIAQLR
jgi:hypothetical protein